MTSQLGEKAIIAVQFVPRIWSVEMKTVKEAVQTSRVVHSSMLHVFKVFFETFFIGVAVNRTVKGSERPLQMTSSKVRLLKNYRTVQGSTDY